MPLFDQERMVKLVSEYRKSIGRLQALSKLGPEEFLNDPDKIGPPASPEGESDPPANACA